MVIERPAEDDGARSASSDDRADAARPATRHRATTKLCQRWHFLHDGDDRAPDGAHLALEQLLHARDGARTVGEDLAPEQVAGRDAHDPVTELLLVEQHALTAA